MKTIIVGFGEIGKAVYNIFSKEYFCEIIQKKEDTKFIKGKFEVMHICFPYSNEFISEVKRYQKIYKPTYTIIHSTVPVGVSRKCNAIHSPVVGIHPYLKESILTFTKFLSGEDASQVADYFRRANIKVYITDKQETTEWIKASCTTFYGICIEYTKFMKEQCDKLNIPFEFWTIWNNSYNEGYKKLGHEEFIRPNLIPLKKKIGGHCVRQNAEFYDNDFTKLIKKRNGKFKNT